MTNEEEFPRGKDLRDLISNLGEVNSDDDQAMDDEGNGAPPEPVVFQPVEHL